MQRKPAAATAFALLRSDQWIKNCFVFSGLLFGERLHDLTNLGNALVVFGLFCAVASAGYIHNDLSDREGDRSHPEKCDRPIASGLVSVTSARLVQTALLALGLGGALLMGTEILLYIGAYVILNFAYTALLKHVVVVDVMTIGVGFVIRVLVGCAAVGATASVWLLLCTFLLALFLGFGKRRHELLILEAKHVDHRPVLGHYGVRFLDQMIGVVSAVTIVCYIMYTVSPETEARHGNTHLVYTVPLVLHGLFRYDFLVYRQSLGGNPTSIVVKDIPLLTTVLVWVLACIGILYLT